MRLLGEPIRILLLEDSELDAELIKAELSLNEVEYTMTRVETEEGFRCALAGFKPHAVLADYRLPSFGAAHLKSPGRRIRSFRSS